jgi:hypothetical protein
MLAAGWCDLDTVGAGAEGCNALGGAVANGLDYLLNASSPSLRGFASSAAQGAAEWTAVGVLGRMFGGEGGVPGCGGSSFSASTQVLIPGGKTTPISQLKSGDTVLAEDTKTGKDQPEAVTAVLVHHDTDLYDLTVKTSTGTEVIHTTASHLFWDPSLNKWLLASNLKPGEHLKTPDGTLATADGGTTPKVHDGWMWDLTVPGNNDHDFYVLPAQPEGDHTYYAVVGSTPILVHNCDRQISDVALGLRAHGLEGFANENGYTHFLDNTMEDALANVRDVANEHPEATIHVRLDGFKMANGSAEATPGQLFDDAVQQGQGSDWFTTQREMAILERAYRVGNLDTSRMKFYLGGKDVSEQVIQQSRYLGGGGG